MSNNNTSSSSHAMPIQRTMFIKPGMTTHHSHASTRNKGKRYNSIPTCYYCGIIHHTRPNCFQIRSHNPWDKKHVPRDDEPVLEIRSIIYVIKLSSLVKN